MLSNDGLILLISRKRLAGKTIYWTIWYSSDGVQSDL